MNIRDINEFLFFLLLPERRSSHCQQPALSDLLCRHVIFQDVS